MGYEDDMWGVGENAETSYSKNEIDKMMSDLYEDIMAEVKEVYFKILNTRCKQY